MTKGTSCRSSSAAHRRRHLAISPHPPPTPHRHPRAGRHPARAPRQRTVTKKVKKTKVSAAAGSTRLKPVVTVKSSFIKRTLRIHAIPLSDDDGGRAFNFTAADLADLVKRANLRFKPASIEIAFDPQHDWRPRRSTALNNLQNSGSGWFTLGNTIASRIPGKIVLFFRHGPGASPTGNGHAYPPNTGMPVPPSVSLPTDNVNYVAFPNTLNGINQGDGNFFCHELGHYLGLYHTFPGWGAGRIYGDDPNSLTGPQAVAAVVRYVRANGGTTAAMNGDLLSDTAPDPCNVVYRAQGLDQTASGPATINLVGTADGLPHNLTFTSRDNVMVTSAGASASGSHPSRSP